MTANPDSIAGEGPARPVSVCSPGSVIAALGARTGTRGRSVSAAALLQRRLERERLRELIAEAEAEHGPVGQAAVDAKRALLRGDVTDAAEEA
ncbi:hypothetical protein [Streptomyces spiramenti]|uniref:Uncharacterized protein n=1 Tax=Streptomyces spiramenti TaxID=2720606 RepID=A0ABX1ADE6_9ACTN|nr:hypothetical protein [Streptomyces spiramenti]NJP65229.1 hypothetical protein [Streptomyces spiramenti]